MTTLNIGRVTAGTPLPASTDCPSCGAKKEQRVDGGSFGPYRLTLCANCGHEFKETDR